MPVFSEPTERSDRISLTGAVGYTNIDLKTNMLLERRPQEKPNKASVT